MLVDLGRNDVGRVARPGSVRVPVYRSVERYSHVMHLVSTVTGRLAVGKSAWDALASCFPRRHGVGGRQDQGAMSLLAGLSERAPRSSTPAPSCTPTTTETSTAPSPSGRCR